MRFPGPKNPKNWQNLHRVAKLGLAASILAFKQAVLSRGERLEGLLSQISDREGRVEAIRGDDIRLLRLLADSLKSTDIGANGQES
jgi:hypothetical protein